MVAMNNNNNQGHHQYNNNNSTNNISHHSGSISGNGSLILGNAGSISIINQAGIEPPGIFGNSMGSSGGVGIGQSSTNSMLINQSYKFNKPL